MANSKSAKKRIKINKRNNIQNNSYKSLMKSSKKKHLSIIEQHSGDLTDEFKSLINQSLALAISQIDKAVKKKIIHKKTAARKKSSLSRNTFALVK
uniref:30S ribosomal protein S20 n=1 Tax=Halosiphon tomentosus TaxID=64927 RepID=UPI002E76DFC7|nr:30S ribosomal protein S20 [Halosiphon tomentosus]WAM63784.1 30S ribosomal protein S20 [Halosiphon tomentosus]